MKKLNREKYLLSMYRRNIRIQIIQTLCKYCDNKQVVCFCRKPSILYKLANVEKDIDIS